MTTNIERRLSKGDGESTGKEYSIVIGQETLTVIANSPEHAYTQLIESDVTPGDKENRKQAIKTALKENYGGWKDIRKSAKRAG